MSYKILFMILKYRLVVMGGDKNKKANRLNSLSRLEVKS